MPTRTIKGYGEFIQKSINISKDIRFFPRFEELIIHPDSVRKTLEEHFKSLPSIEKCAIAQQYNEMYIWHENVTNENSKLIAPIVDVSYDSYTNLPILTYPRFEAITAADTFYSLSYEEGLIKLGFFCQEKSMEFDQVADFMMLARELCGAYELNPDDILGNLSNIGWHPTLGLRIIDFGLKEAKNNCELIF